LKIGVAQIELTTHISSNIDKIAQYTSIAGNKGLVALCFPECALTGYIRDFSSLSSQDLYRGIDTLHKIAIERKVNIIVGTPYFEEGERYNAALVLLVSGSRFVYKKRLLTEFDKRYFREGNEALVFEIGNLTGGVIICRDQNDPLLAKEYRQSGVRILFLPSAHYYQLEQAKLKVEKNRALPIARAVENEFYIFKANAVGSQGGATSLGHSLIVDPKGLVVTEADETSEDLLYTEA
jgi:predicted amidohydrolase